MMVARTIDRLEVYWEAQDPGWAYRIAHRNGDGEYDSLDSGAVESDGDLDAAINEACRYHELALTPDEFDREPFVDGGFATWTTP